MGARMILYTTQPTRGFGCGSQIEDYNNPTTYSSGCSIRSRDVAFQRCGVPFPKHVGLVYVLHRCWSELEKSAAVD